MSKKTYKYKISLPAKVCIIVNLLGSILSILLSIINSNIYQLFFGMMQIICCGLVYLLEREIQFNKWLSAILDLYIGEKVEEKL